MSESSLLYSPYTLKNLDLRNRVVMPPMCQYQAENGMSNDWHEVHYAARAIGGVGLVIVEMTNVSPDGRISAQCLGLWNDEQAAALKRIVDAAHRYGAKIAVQIGHAGSKSLAGSGVVSSSAIVYGGASEDLAGSRYQMPRALSTAEVQEMVQRFQAAVKRAVAAGFDAVEIHGAHGYLIHQFHSPKFNQRDDIYGQDKMRFGAEVLQAAKAVMPAEMPLIVRISAQEYSAGGYGADYGQEIARRYVAAGADAVHVSGGGDGLPDAAHTPKIEPGYQVYLARAVKAAVDVPVIAVGLLDDADLAESVLQAGDADLIANGRGLLRDPNWVLNSQYRRERAKAHENRQAVQFVPAPYRRAF